MMKVVGAPLVVVIVVVRRTTRVISQHDTETHGLLPLFVLG